MASTTLTASSPPTILAAFVSSSSLKGIIENSDLF
jgi:hypothetical protein